ncbi:hypothetical protein HDV02_000639 [Globomyces sp. JEL0801]|nr:hypothetical protein HDV02_000639 [Globomyces sp. JEL0801]
MEIRSIMINILFGNNTAVHPTCRTPKPDPKQSSLTSVNLSEELVLYIYPKNDTYYIQKQTPDSTLMYHVSKYPALVEDQTLSWNLQFTDLVTKEAFQITRLHKTTQIKLSGNQYSGSLIWKYPEGSDRAVYELSVKNSAHGSWKGKSYGGYKYVKNGHILAELDETEDQETWGKIVVHPEGMPFLTLLVSSAFMIAYRNLV